MKSRSGVWGTWLALATLLAAIAMFGPVHAAENILVMGEDADGDYIPCHDRAFVAVRNAVANQLGDRGFRVYDETAVTMDNFDQGRCRRKDAELIDIARSIERTTIDVAVLFRIYVAKDPLDYTTKVSARIEGRLLDAHSGQRLGYVEVDEQQWRVTTDCRRECLFETVRRNSRALGVDLGTILADKLDSDPGGGEANLGGGGPPDPAGRIREYALEFENFTREDIDQIDGYLKIFTGYDEHLPNRMSATRASYAYHSSLAPAKLSSNLNRMLKEMQEEGGNRWSATINMNGNTFTVRKLVRRNVRRTQSDDSFQW